MSMTREEKVAKNYLRRVLASNGYRTYSEIFQKFDFNFTSDPSVVAYMIPEKGVIVANRGLDEHQICVIIRHEILHAYLMHEQRLLAKLAEERGIDLDDIDDTTLDELKGDLYKNKDFNIAGDFEISNRGYTEKDKEIVRNIELNGRTLSGLVTEDHHPEWVDMSIEEMYDALQKERQKEDTEVDDDVVSGILISSNGGIPPIFVGADGVVYGSKQMKKMWYANGGGFN